VIGFDNPMSIATVSGWLGLGFVLIFLLVMVVYFFLGRRNKSAPALRVLPAFLRLERVIGLAVEAGRRLHISLGWGGLSGTPAGASLVGLSVLRRIAGAAYTSDRPPVATSGEPVLSILSQDAFRAADRATEEQSFDAASGQLTGLTPFSFAAGVLPVIYDRQVSANLLIGHFGTELGLIADASERSGGLTLAGSDNLTGQAVAYATAQEPLIGEELYTSGAYIHAGPLHVASLQAHDVLRWLIVGVILVGLILHLAGLLQ
jgi:hypothetical protein